MSGSILSLNSDVLDYILQHCSTSALIALSLVSSQLHPLTTRYLLHTVHLDRNPKQIFDFLNFVVDRTCQTKSSEILGPGSLTVRFTMVLAFQTFKPESGMFLPMKKEEYPVSAWAPLLTRALTLMPNLCSVVIGDLVEEICISSADFPSALLSRPRLTSLTLGNVGPTASRYFGQAMERMKDIPNFHIVDIGSDHGVFESALQITPHTGIGQALFRSSACLTEISLRGRIDLRGFVGNGHSETGDKKRITPVIFPNVVKLLISDRDVSLRGLATTFPALENLILRFLVVARDPSLDRPMQVTFSSLISIQGLCQNIAPFLEANADRERIRRIVIEGTWDRDEDEVTPFAILKATPYLKSLRFRQDPVRPLSWWEAFAQTIPHLTYLGLSLYTANRADVVVCTQIPQSLANVPLIYVAFAFEGYEWLFDSNEVKRLVEPHTMAMLYARNIPTLQFISVRAETHRDYDSVMANSWWKVLRAKDGTVSLAALTEFQGESMANHYDIN